MLANLSTLSRRSFLTAAPAGLAALNLAALNLAAAPSPNLPVGCRDAMLRPLDPECWTAAREVAAEVIEVTVNDQFALPSLSHPQQPYSIATPEGVHRLTEDLQGAGVRISAFCVESRFDTRPDFECEFTAKLAHIAQQMAIPAIRLDVLTFKMQPREFVATAVSLVKRVIAATEDTNVRFGTENHGPRGNDPSFLLPLIDGVASKRFGVTLDTGNLYWFGRPLSQVYDLMEKLAPHAVHTHCKNIAYPAEKREEQRPTGWEYARYEAPVDRGDIDFTKVVKILRAAGYTGDLCVENETLNRLPAAERAPVLAAEIAYLKKLRG
jgi:sugar phosphate isomerase/epimerase